jgi:hypothetical protein
MSSRQQIAEPQKSSSRRKRRKSSQQRASGKTKQKQATAAEFDTLSTWSEDDWQAFVKRIASRKRPRPLSEISLGSSQHPLLWASSDRLRRQFADSGLSELLHAVARPRRRIADVRQLAASWLTESERTDPDLLFAYQCLAWCHLLPRLAEPLGQQMWSELATRLCDIAESSAGISLDDEPVSHQLLNGELPWTLSYLFPEVPDFNVLAQSACHALSRGAVELLDGEGLPAARHMGQLRTLLACWTRCLLMKIRDVNCLDRDGHEQYEWMVRQALRTNRADGSSYLEPVVRSRQDDDLLTAAISCGADAVDRWIASHLLPGMPTSGKTPSEKKLPAPCVYSEWSEACMMRSSWKRKSPHFAALFDDQRFRFEFSVKGEILFAGAWDPRISIDGELQTFQSDWRELCWYQDHEVQYLELEIDLQEGWLLQRQLLLGSTDSLLFVADVLLGPDPAELTYQSAWPLGPNATFQPEPETRDGFLRSGGAACAVMPVALPEWSSANSPGTLQPQDKQLMWEQSSVGKGLYVPLCLDFARRRIRRERTWRQLTVAERLEIQPADVAVGYRIQSAREQWLIYRSLTKKANRTLLGQNISDEFVFARFTRDGELEALIEID